LACLLDSPARSFRHLVEPRSTMARAAALLFCGAVASLAHAAPPRVVNVSIGARFAHAPPVNYVSFNLDYQ
jgi:hypothetical protein